MSYTFDGTNDRITGSFTSTYAGDTFTIAAYVKYTDHPAAIDTIAMIGNNSGDNLNSHSIRTTGTDNQFAVASIEGGTASTASVSHVADGTWIPVVGIITSNTQRDIRVATYANTAQATTARDVADALQFISIGESLDLANDATMSIAEVAMWNIALGQSAIEAYMAGTVSTAIEAANLIGYWPLSADNATQSNEGVDAGGDLSVANAIFNADHPTITAGGGSATRKRRMSLMGVG